MKFRVIVCDCPWGFSDSLTMSDTKRGAGANYSTLSIQDLKDLPVKDLCAKDAVLALWCPSSLLAEGLEVMQAWGFRQTQTHIWVKTKKIPLSSLVKDVVKQLKSVLTSKEAIPNIKDLISNADVSNVLAFGMGRLFRQTHEVVLIGVRGKIYNHLENKSQRSVHFHPATKHSAKPENLQDYLEKMFPGENYLEMFARRDRNGWTCVGLECPSCLGEDIKDSLNRLNK